MDENMNNPFADKKPNQAMSNDKGQKTAKEKAQQDQSQRLNEIVSNLQLYYERSTDKCYCKLIEDDESKIIDIDDSYFEEWLYFTYSEKFNKSYPTGIKMKPLKKILRYKAKRQGQEIISYNRIACINDQIWIDLMDQNNSVILVNKHGWEKTCNPGIHFKRYPNQAALPIPEKGGDLKVLLKLAPAMNVENQVLVLSWLIVSYFTDTSGAFIWFKGTEGSGKTLFATFLKSLIDPVYGKGYSLPTDHEELAQILDHHCVAFFDNVSQMNKKLSDMFCKA